MPRTYVPGAKLSSNVSSPVPQQPSQPARPQQPNNNRTCCAPQHMKPFSTYLPPHPVSHCMLDIKRKHTTEYINVLSRILDEIDQWLRSSYHEPVEEQQHHQHEQHPRQGIQVNDNHPLITPIALDSATTVSNSCITFMKQLITEATTRQGPLVESETVCIVEFHICILQYLHHLNWIRLHPPLLQAMNDPPSRTSFPQMFAPRLVSVISNHFKHIIHDEHDKPTEPNANEQAYITELREQMNKNEAFIDEYICMVFSGTSMISVDTFQQVQECVNQFYSCLVNSIKRYQPQWIVHADHAPGYVMLFHMELLAHIHRLDYVVSPTVIHMHVLTHVHTKVEPFAPSFVWDSSNMTNTTVCCKMQNMMLVHHKQLQLQARKNRLIDELKQVEQQQQQLEQHQQQQSGGSSTLSTWLSTFFSLPLPQLASLPQPPLASVSCLSTTVPNSPILSATAASFSDSEQNPKQYPAAHKSFSPKPGHATILFYGDKYDSIHREAPLQVVYLPCEAMIKQAATTKPVSHLTQTAKSPAPLSAQLSDDATDNTHPAFDKSLSKERWNMLRRLCNIVYNARDIRYSLEQCSLEQYSLDHIGGSGSGGGRMDLSSIQPLCTYRLTYYHKHRPGRYIIYNVYDKETLVSKNMIPLVLYFNFVSHTYKGNHHHTTTSIPDAPIKTTTKEIISLLYTSFQLDSSSQPISIYRSVNTQEWERVIGRNNIGAQSMRDRSRYYYYVMPKDSIKHTVEHTSVVHHRDLVDNDNDDDDDDDDDDSTQLGDKGNMSIHASNGMSSEPLQSQSQSPTCTTSSFKPTTDTCEHHEPSHNDQHKTTTTILHKRAHDNQVTTNRSVRRKLSMSGGVSDDSDS